MPPEQGEIVKLLRENHQLMEENNKMLKAMRRAARIGFFFKLLVFILVLGIPTYVYFTVVQPYLESVPNPVESFIDKNINEFLKLEDFTRHLQERQSGEDPSLAPEQ
jgi:hypothetical protein